jgi:chromosome segregation ATPase
MHYLFQQSSPSLAVWFGIAGTLLGVSATLLGTWLNRKRRSSVRAEDRKTHAEATKLEIESIADLYEQLRATRAELTAIIHEGAEKSRELRELHAKQIEFLQSQVEIKTEAEFDARQNEQKVRTRFHASQNEIQRCIFRMRDYEELIRKCEPKVEFVPFDFTPYKDIMEGRGEH